MGSHRLPISEGNGHRWIPTCVSLDPYQWIDYLTVFGTQLWHLEILFDGLICGLKHGHCSLPQIRISKRISRCHICNGRASSHRSDHREWVTLSASLLGRFRNVKARRYRHDCRDVLEVNHSIVLEEFSYSELQKRLAPLPRAFGYSFNMDQFYPKLCKAWLFGNVLVVDYNQISIASVLMLRHCRSSHQNCTSYVAITVC